MELSLSQRTNGDEEGEGFNGKSVPKLNRMGMMSLLRGGESSPGVGREKIVTTWSGEKQNSNSTGKN